MTQLSLRLFGLPVLAGPDGPLTGAPVQRHRLALLALLARAPGHCLSRDKLIGHLWPETDARQGRHLLSVSVHEIRKALGESALVSHADGLRLDTDVLRVDVLEFEARAVRGDGQRAAELWVGPFLDGFYLESNGEFEEWAAGERRRLLGRYEAVLTGLADDATAKGARVEAVDWCRRLVATDPFNSRYVLRLMAAMEAAGDPGNAVEAARSHEALLDRELGATPDPAVRQLAERLRNAPLASTTPTTISPAPAPAVAERGATTAATGTSPLVGPPVGKRARRTGPIVATLVAVALGLLVVLRPRPSVEVGRILVLPFANQTADASLDPLGRIIADRITDGLARIDSVDVVDSRATIAAEQIGSGSAGIDADPTRLAAELGAALVLTGAYRLEGDSLVISARVANVPDGRVVVALSEISALASDPMVGVEELRARGMGAIASLASRRTGEPTGPQLAAPRYPAYLEYVAGLDRLSWWRRGLDALPYFLRAAALDSGFAAPVFWAAYLVERCVRSGLPSFGETRCSAGQRDSLLTALEGMKSGLGPVEREGLTYLRAMAAGDDDGGFAAASRASRLAPHSLWSAEAIAMANARGQFEDVVRLAGATGIAEGWSRQMSATAVAWASHALGRFSDELAATRATRRAFPDIAAYRAEELRAMAALGMTDSVRAGLDDLVSRWGPLQGADAAQMLIRHLRGHGHPEAARAVGQSCVDFFFADSSNMATYAAYFGAVCLHAVGRPAQAARVLERVVGHGGQYRELALQWLAVLAAQEEDRSLAEHYLLELVRDAEPSQFLISRARVAAALGDHERAVASLRRAFANNPFWRSVHRDAADPGWESIQGYRPYRALVDSGR